MRDGKPEPLESGPLAIGDEVAGLVIFETPQMVGDLGLGIAASVRTRYSMPPAVVSAALRQLADTIDMQYGTAGACGGCGGHHG